MLRPTARLRDRQTIASALVHEAGVLGEPYWRGVARLAQLFDEFVDGADAVSLEASIQDLEHEAVLAKSARLAWHQRLARTSLLRLQGQYAEADRQADQAYIHAVASSIPDAEPASLVHRFLADLETSTVAPLLALMEQYAEQQPSNPLTHAALAVAAMQAHRPLVAASAVGVVVELAEASRGDERTALSLSLVAETAVGLGERRHIDVLTEALSPYSGQFIVFGQVTGTLGPADRVLGLLRAAAGERGQAVALLRTAEEQSRRMGWRPWSVRCATDRERLGN